MLNGSTLVSRVAAAAVVIFSAVHATALAQDPGHDQRLEAALNSRRPRFVPATIGAAAAEP
jgi:hypothetical protein